MDRAIAEGEGPVYGSNAYIVLDDQMAAGSTLGSPCACLTIKSTGAIEAISSIETGKILFGALVLHHWDIESNVRLNPVRGSFTLHPEHQEHNFGLSNGIALRERVFVLNSGPHRGKIDPPATYYDVELRNRSSRPLRVATYAFCQLRGNTAHDVEVSYDRRRHAFLAWNKTCPNEIRVFACSKAPAGYETTIDHAKSIAERRPPALSGTTTYEGGDPLAVFELTHTLGPGESAGFYFLFTFFRGSRTGSGTALSKCPSAGEALQATRRYYRRVLNRSVLMTPEEQVNRGVLWAKANMLRVQAKAQTGWAFTNDPQHSNNSVARDTAWYAYGSDYVTPWFSRASLMGYVARQGRNGMIPEYYDIRTGQTNDYGLNINDNTPLLILALWHHYQVTGDRRFLARVYPAVRKAARYILSQRNDQGLVWCTAAGSANSGIVGWRNVIEDYRLSGATTELNAECYAALVTSSRMARLLERHKESAQFAARADALRKAINQHLSNPDNDLYYLNITLDGTPRSDITADLVFPVMFGVAPPGKASRIIGRLSSSDFWTDAGIRTVPRDAPNYSPGPRPGYGLLGGVWVAVSFWYAFAAAPFMPQFMAHALTTTFRHYSQDPRRNNTVPGQFSEWLHGETLVNEGMMLSPWFPPRYVWAAIEGAAGLSLGAGDELGVTPRLASEWKWLAARNVPYRGKRLCWLIVRAPQLHLFTNFDPVRPRVRHEIFSDDVTPFLSASDKHLMLLALRGDRRLLLFAGNPSSHTTISALRYKGRLAGRYRYRYFDSMLNRWQESGEVSAGDIRSGLAVHLERKGFWLIQLEQTT